jgi:predicted nucleotidyltransferase
MMNVDNECFDIIKNNLQEFIDSDLLLDVYDDFKKRSNTSHRSFIFLKTSLCTRKFLNGITFEILFDRSRGRIEIAFVQNQGDEYLQCNVNDAIANIHPELQKFVSFNINYFVETHYPTALD